jgi:HlyD family secretion protein
MIRQTFCTTPAKAHAQRLSVQHLLLGVRPALAIALTLLAVFTTSCRRGGDDASVLEVRKGRIEVWTIADGYLESRNVKQVMSKLNGPATVVETMPDGAPVAEGDVVARFDSAQLERDALKLERDFTLAKEDLSSLTNAKLPLEIRDLELRLADANTRYDDEKQALEDTRDLVKEELTSDKDIQQQQARVESAKTACESLKQQVELTKKYIHPSLVERAKATLSSAEQELDIAKRQLANCEIHAPAAGVVAYKPLTVGGEFRAIRVGDTVYKNQPFMTVSDMTNLVMYCDVFEGEVTRYKPGCQAFVLPTAFPELALKATVESLGSTARTVPGRANGQKFFSVLLRLDEADPRLRSGMSAEARILSYAREDAILIPRMAVTWEDGVPWCGVKGLLGVKKTKLSLGPADERNYEVIDGVKPGDRLVVK